ncbi:MAG TPA: glycosyltransferase family 4 protein [Acidimicrobiales bacterium]|nr:glycosyltransferase family 4 protein [Acidimicrobiales bacterium]
MGVAAGSSGAAGGPRLTVVVHDYSGHPGQVQLSRALAGRGHRVTHQHCPSYVTGKGAVEPMPDDPPTLSFQPCPMAGEFKRYSPVKRVAQEVAYGRRVGALIAGQRPDVAILSNVPLLAHALVALRLWWERIPMVFWHQDIYSAAITAAAEKRLGPAGRVLGWVADRMERMIARSSAAIVAISPTFLPKLRSWGVKEAALNVVPNWAPIEDLPVRDKDNPWSDRMGLSSSPVLLYSGTLGLKHDPSILALVADHLRTASPEARVVVISEGKGRDWLEEWKRDHGAENLLLLDYQPYPDLPDVMGTADVLMAILEPDASKYSVPSKVLSYLCAGRAIVGFLPGDNSIAEILEGNQAGMVVDPAGRDKIGPAVAELIADGGRRRGMGEAGRHYAESAFSPEAAADRFETVIYACLARSHP